MFRRRRDEVTNSNNSKNLNSIDNDNDSHNYGKLKRKITDRDLNNINLNNIRNKDHFPNYTLYNYYNRKNNNYNNQRNYNKRIDKSNSNKNIYSSYADKYKYNSNKNDNDDYNDYNTLNANKRTKIMRPSKSALPNKRTSYDHNHNYNYNEDDNKEGKEFLLCQNCINEKLIEEKRRQKELSKRSSVPAVFEDKYKNYSQNLINEKLRQREKNTKEIYQNLEYWNELNEKDKLIKKNENSINPLYKDNHNYVYEKFRTNYERKQKLIRDNYNKFQNPERAEITDYYNNYINNPKYQGIDYGEYRPKKYDMDNYRKDLDEQVRYKNNKKKREKEEDKIRENQQYNSDLKYLENEKREKELKKRKMKDELIRGNLELINAKQRNKEKLNEEDLRYREYYDKQNMEYQNDLLNEKQRKRNISKEYYNENQKNLSRIKRRKEEQIIENENYKYNDSSYEPPKEPTAECSRCHRIYPKKLLTPNMNYYFYANRK